MRFSVGYRTYAAIQLSRTVNVLQSTDGGHHFTPVQVR